MADINPVLAAARQSADSSQILRGEAEYSLQHSSKLDEILMDAARETANNSAEILRTKGAGELEAQDRSRAVAEALGNDPMQANSRLIQMIQTHNQYADKAIAQAKEIEQRQSVSFADNPFAWLENQFVVPGMVEDYNNTVDVANAASNEVSTMESLTTNSAQAFNAIAKTITAESIKAAADNAVKEGLIKSAQIDQAGLGRNMQYIGAMQQADQQQMDNAYRIFSAQDALESAELRRQQMSLVLDEKTKAEVEDNQYIKFINAGYRQENVSGAELNPETIKQMRKNGDAKTKAQLDRWFNTGLGVLSSPTRQFPIAGSMEEAAAIVVRNNNGLPPEMKVVQDKIKAAWAAANTEIVKTETAEKVKLVPEQQKAILSSMLSKTIATDAANVEVGSDGNLFRAHTIKSIIATVPAAVESPFGKKVLLPAVKAGVNDLSVDQMLDLGVDALHKNEITAAELSSGIKQFYQSAVTQNNVVKDYVRVGIPPQNSYNVTVKASGILWDKDIKINALDEATIQRAILLKRFNPAANDPLGLKWLSGGTM